MMYVVEFSMRSINRDEQISRPLSILHQIAKRMFPFFALGILGATLLSACGTIQVRAGLKPNINVLQSLQPGKTTKQEVLAALGNPEGQGRSMFPWQNSPRTLWSYYYEEGAINLGGNSDDRRIFLFVFFKNNRFDGYMWFSSLKPLQ